MEPKFELRYKPQKKNTREFYYRYHGGLRIFAVVVALLNLVAISINAAIGGGTEDTIMYFWVTLVLLAAALVTPYYLAHVNYKQALKMHDGVIPETVVTVGETIEISDGMAQMTLEYRKITKVIRLKNAYVLMVHRNGLILDINGFTKGTFAEFKQFLREQRPDLKVPE